MRAAVGISAVALAGAMTASAQAAQPPTAAGQDSSSGYVVLAKDGVSPQTVADELSAAGATVTSVNTAIGLVTVSTAPAGFAAKARSLPGVQAAGADRVVGHAPKRRAADRVLKEHMYEAPAPAPANQSAKVAAAPSDPLDSNLWGMDMINAPAAHRIELGDKRVRVGILDTGVDATHPDLAANFDRQLSRNFTYDIPDIDGPCEQASCVDAPTADDDGHGTHVAGTIAAAMNGFGVSGVAPNVDVVNIRGGQDSGFFFLGPVANALTYAGDNGIDVVNMSFYVDPWLYNCRGGAPEDGPAAAGDQDLILTVMKLALNYAHRKNVTLVSALGNEHDNLAHPRTDITSPDYPPGTAYPRTIDNATCLNLPLEGPHVIGVSALGPSGTKADYSNYTSAPWSTELELSAPGGYFRDGFGTPTFRTIQNEILSTAPLGVLQSEGLVDPAGNITPTGEGAGVMKQCTDTPAPGASNCGYYQYLQGTSMASPHVAGVAALAVSAHGAVGGGLGFHMDPDAVTALLQSTASDHACPTPRLQSYVEEGRPAEFDARCQGPADRNGFYGEGVANALGVVR